MMKELFDLYFTFCKIGAFMFGGGYSMLPLLCRELTDRKHWVTEEELLDYFAVAQCTPGIIAVNTATFVGFKRHKIAGSIFATLGVVTVPILLILVIASLLRNIWDNAIFQHALVGIRIAVAALVTASVIRLVKTNVKDIWGISAAVISFLCIAVLGFSPVYIVLGIALLGLIKGSVRKT